MEDAPAQTKRSRGPVTAEFIDSITMSFEYWLAYAPQQAGGTRLFCVPYVSPNDFYRREASSGTQENLLFS
jgi:hypothetical protein